MNTFLAYSRFWVPLAVVGTMIASTPTVSDAPEAVLTATAEAATSTEASEPTARFDRYVENPTLAEICACESTGNRYGIPRQFNADGTVLRGVINPQDVGMCQINERYHLADSQRLGYDIYTEAGNWGYGLYLLETQGTKPWNWSRHCWDWRLDHD